jgi:hypothetical protein
MASDALALHDTLVAGAEAGATVRVIYHGGSQPGTVREIRPLQVTDLEVRAYDVAAGMAKTFVLARMVLPGGGETLVAYEPPPPRPPGEEERRDIEALMRAHVPALEKLGWEVTLSPDTIALASIYAYFKNGKPRKATAVSLTYRPVTEGVDDDVEEVESISLILTPQGTRIEQRMREPRRAARGRPYSLNVKGISTTRAFGRPSSAVAAFLTEVRRLGPPNPPAPPPSLPSPRRRS